MAKTRREFLAASAVAGGALWLGACGGDEKSASTGGGSGSGPTTGTVTFTTWGSPAEIKAIRA